MIREFRFYLGSALVEDLPGGDRVTECFAGIGNLEQSHHELGGALCRLGFGFCARPLSLRLVACQHRVGGKTDRKHHSRHGGRCNEQQVPLPTLLFPLPQVVKAHPQHAGQQLDLGVVLAILAGPGVGGDRFGGFIGEFAVCRPA